jgi:uncharacterized protein YkwD
MTISTSTIASMRIHLKDLHNANRANYGVKRPLALNSTLNNIAQGYANQVASKNWWSPSHTRPNGMCFAIWWNSKAPYAWAQCQSCSGPCARRIGENLARGQRSNADVVAAWMASTLHRANILNGNFAYVGFGIQDSSSGIRYWVAHFLG